MPTHIYSNYRQKITGPGRWDLVVVLYKEKLKRKNFIINN